MGIRGEDMCHLGQSKTGAEQRHQQYARGEEVRADFLGQGREGSAPEQEAEASALSSPYPSLVPLYLTKLRTSVAPLK